MGRRKTDGLLGIGSGFLSHGRGPATQYRFACLEMLTLAFLFADGGFAMVGPYAAEVCLRACGPMDMFRFGCFG